MSDRDRGGFFQGLLMGALVGAGVYYWLTQTKEGEKVKKQLKKKGEEALDNLGELVEDFETRGEEFRAKAEEIQAKLEAKVEEATGGEAKEAREKITHIEKLRKRGRMASTKFFTKNGKPLTS